MTARKLRYLIATSMLTLMLALSACGGGTNTSPDGGSNVGPTVTTVP
jgi:hypothetical protein